MGAMDISRNIAFFDSASSSLTDSTSDLERLEHARRQVEHLREQLKSVERSLAQIQTNIEMDYEALSKGARARHIGRVFLEMYDTSSKNLEVPDFRYNVLRDKSHLRLDAQKALQKRKSGVSLD